MVAVTAIRQYGVRHSSGEGEMISWRLFAALVFVVGCGQHEAGSGGRDNDMGLTLEDPKMDPAGNPSSSPNPSLPPGCVAEICGNGHDDDCNSFIDDGCNCAAGDTEPCYTGP